MSKHKLTVFSFTVFLLLSVITTGFSYGLLSDLEVANASIANSGNMADANYIGNSGNMASTNNQESNLNQNQSSQNKQSNKNKKEVEAENGTERQARPRKIASPS